MCFPSYRMVKMLRLVDTQSPALRVLRVCKYVLTDHTISPLAELFPLLVHFLHHKTETALGHATDLPYH